MQSHLNSNSLSSIRSAITRHMLQSLTLSMSQCVLVTIHCNLSNDQVKIDV